MKILIIGTHVLAESVRAQYEANGQHTDCYDEWQDGLPVSCYGEFCLLPALNGSLTDTDAETLRTLEQLAESIERETVRRPLCHVLLHSPTTRWLLQTQDVYQTVHERLEVYAFTVEDQWAQNVLCVASETVTGYPPLDREPVIRDIDRTVHLALFGWSRMAESLVLHTALTAHYPNYVRNQTLRTRITIVCRDVQRVMNGLVQRYQSLFSNSYYRQLQPDKQQQVLFHEPQFCHSRHDFVDVEWEFVEGDIHQSVVQQKLTLWAESPRQLLTIALTHEASDRNFEEAFVCPPAVYDRNIPVYLYARRSSLLAQLQGTERYRNLYPIGMEDCGYDVSLPLLQMAKRLNYFYVCSSSGKGIPTDLPADEVEREWQQIRSFGLRYSNIYHVMSVASKMRSLGHVESDWRDLHALTREEMQLLSVVEHNRWSVERLLLGFRPPTDAEKENIRQHIELKKEYKEQRVHYDLCSYDELGEDETAQDVRRYDYDLTVGIPLIAHYYYIDRSV